jgi:hypothetical protein
MKSQLPVALVTILGSILFSFGTIKAQEAPSLEDHGFGESEPTATRVYNSFLFRENVVTVTDSRFSKLIDLNGGEPVGADVEDIVRYTPREYPDLSLFLQLKLGNNPSLFAQDGQLESPVRLQAAPVQDPDETSHFQMSVLIKGPQNQEFYRKFQVTLGGKPLQIQEISVLQDIPLNQVKFTVEVGLVSRLVILRDQQHGLTLNFPLGVGSLDFGVSEPGNRILTPLFHNATLRSATVTHSRIKPDYYRGQPFMPITNQHGVQTPIAFHITILNDDEWADGKGANFLIRGFDSHGCMRLRLKDLTEFFDVVIRGGSRALPVTVDYFVFKKNADGSLDTSFDPENISNPYPLRMDGYKQVQNFADPGQPPQAQRDDTEEQLLILQDVPGVPDLSNLDGFSADDATDLQTFMSLANQLKLKHKH